MKKVLTIAVCALFAGVVAAAPAKKVVTSAEKTVATAEQDCSNKKLTAEEKTKCEAEKAAAVKEEKKVQ